ncbi:N-6 DNA methylase [Streptomyces pini]|uniref:Type I restriction enzyme M protein n=1 Tax=Streptomyces pini TaxID=1520580 RepID=A0A1I3UH93_9ACTN|nr:N-6 DNA methylase [Streptomyces pini]SFJ82292.1 type I restriction enzyme M protein [Streptomyces pini]
MEDLTGRLVSRAEIARLAGVRRPAVSNWERRHPDTFPGPVSAGESGTELFRAAEVANWLDRRVIPVNARGKDEPAGMTYGDRFRAGSGASTVASSRAVDAAPLLRVVERLASDDTLLPRGSVPLPDRAEMLLALIYLCGSQPRMWSSLRKLADHTAHGPETAGLRQVIAGGLPTGLSPSTVQSWQGREQALADAVRLIDAHAAEDRGQYVRAFDLLVRKYAEEWAGRAGSELFTPVSVARTAAALVTPTVDATEAHDPFCRAGEMLTAVVDTWTATGSAASIRVSGAGLPEFSLRLARLGLGLRGHSSAEMKPGTTAPSALTAPLGRKVDLLLANPPFNVRGAGSAPRQGHWQYGPPPSHNANFDWLQYAVDLLSPGGRACLVMANIAATSANRRERTIRSAMVEDGAVECLVSLPPGLFFSTGIPVTLWILRAPRGRCDEILFIDARALGEMLSRSVRHLPDHEVAAVAREYHAWRDAQATGTAYRGRAGFSRSASIGEIRGNGYALAPSLYVSPAPVEGSAPDHHARIDHLRDELAKLHEEAARIDAAVESILRRHSA